MRRRPVGRPRDEDVDRRILDAALAVFADLGWSGLTMEGVAKRAGVGKASLYLRWSNTTDLLTDAVTLRFAGPVSVHSTSLREDLVLLTEGMLRLYLGPLGAASLRMQLESRSIPAIDAHYDAIRSSQVREARGIINRAVDRGEIPAGTSASLLLDMLLGGALMHVLASSAEQRDRMVLNVGSIAESMVDFLLGRLRPGAGAE